MTSDTMSMTHDHVPMGGVRTAVKTLAVCVAVVLSSGSGPIAMGQSAPADAPSGPIRSPGVGAVTQVEGDSSSRSAAEIIFSGGMVGFLILLVLVALSVGAAALAIEHLMTIRKRILMPPGLGDQVRRQLAAGNLAGADAACQSQPSLLAFVLHAGLVETDGGWAAVEKGMEDAIAEQAARLFRKIEYLSVIGNIAPMIGLLGTVMGMIFAFQEVAETQGAARAAQLAEGIYTALITTVGGLLVAIPSLAAFAVFRNRVDQLVAEAAYMAQQILAVLKRPRPTARQGSVAAPPVGGAR